MVERLRSISAPLPPQPVKADDASKAEKNARVSVLAVGTGTRRVA